MHDIPIIHIRQQRQRWFWKMTSQIAQRRKLFVRSRLVDPVQMRRPEVPPHGNPQWLDLIWRYEALGHAKQNDGHAIIVRRPRDRWRLRVETQRARMRRLDARA